RGLCSVVPSRRSARHRWNACQILIAGPGRTMSNQKVSAANDPRARTNESEFSSSFDRRTFLQGAAATSLVGAAALSLPNLTRSALAADDLDAIRKQIEMRHDQSVRQLQEWIKQPSIAAENRGM